MSQFDLLTGKAEDEFESAKERFGVWPTTVWEHKRNDPRVRAALELIGDAGEERATSFAGTGGSGCYVIGASLFSPAVASWVLNLYAPSSGVCFDPFAGGGTRAIMAAKHGLRYVGTELRGAEVQAVYDRCDRAGVRAQVDIRCCDARQAGLVAKPHSADFCYTCPPYYDLERYGGGPRDLSELPSYGSFLEALGTIIEVSGQVLKLGTLSVWVVGHTRGPKGELLALNHDVARLHQAAGFRLREEVIIYHVGGAAIQRIGNFSRGARPPGGYLEDTTGFLVRMHEYALVFENVGRVPT